jgi:hypothetical protein
VGEVANCFRKEFSNLFCGFGVCPINRMFSGSSKMSLWDVSTDLSEEAFVHLILSGS